MNRKKIFLLTTSLFFILSTNVFAGPRTVNGVLIGGGIGALAGQAIGGNVESTIFGTAAGSVIGLAIGSSRDSHRHYTHAQRGGSKQYRSERRPVVYTPVRYRPEHRPVMYAPVRYRPEHRPVVYAPVRGPAHYAPRHDPHYNHSSDNRRRDNRRW